MAAGLIFDGMMGQDIQGMAGFPDKVDNHYKRLIGSALLNERLRGGDRAVAENRTRLSSRLPRLAKRHPPRSAKQLGELRVRNHAQEFEH